MTKLPSSILLYVLIDFFLLAVSLTHIPSLINRSMFPFSVAEKNGTFIIETVANEEAQLFVSAGDTVVSVNDSSISLTEQLEFISDNLAIGSSCKIGISLRNELIELIHFVCLIPGSGQK